MGTVFGRGREHAEQLVAGERKRDVFFYPWSVVRRCRGRLATAGTDQHNNGNQRKQTACEIPRFEYRAASSKRRPEESVSIEAGLGSRSRQMLVECSAMKEPTRDL